MRACGGHCRAAGTDESNAPHRRCWLTNTSQRARSVAPGVAGDTLVTRALHKKRQVVPTLLPCTPLAAAPCKELGEMQRPPCSVFATEGSGGATAAAAAADGDCSMEPTRQQQETWVTEEQPQPQEPQPQQEKQEQQAPPEQAQQQSQQPQQLPQQQPQPQQPPRSADATHAGSSPAASRSPVGVAFGMLVAAAAVLVLAVAVALLQVGVWQIPGCHACWVGCRVACAPAGERLPACSPCPHQQQRDLERSHACAAIHLFAAWHAGPHPWLAHQVWAVQDARRGGAGP